MKDHIKVREHACPKCGYKADCVSDPFNNKGFDPPSEGDLSMCLNCGGMFAFTKDLQLRLPTEEEKEWIQNQYGITLMQLARADVVGNRDLTKKQNESENESPQ
jgi:hypothetical protein